MAGSSGMKLGRLVEGRCPNVLTKDFFRSVNRRGKINTLSAKHSVNKKGKSARSLLPPK